MSIPQTKAELIALLGEPDRIITSPGSRMLSPHWMCSLCAKVHAFAEPVPFPSVCDGCGGNCFEKPATL